MLASLPQKQQASQGASTAKIETATALIKPPP
jgi:hypothetical protein